MLGPELLLVYTGNVPFQRLGQAMLVTVHFEYLDGLVARAGRESPSVVIEDGVVLRGR